MLKLEIVPADAYYFTFSSRARRLEVLAHKIHSTVGWSLGTDASNIMYHGVNL